VSWCLLLDKVERMTAAAVAAGDEEADLEEARHRLHLLMDEPIMLTPEQAETRELKVALGVGV
jgi:phage terminase Nu1 subunit (DNA packaging protein)